MNAMNVPSKRSTLERKLDKLILALFGGLFLMCLIGAIARWCHELVFAHSVFLFFGLPFHDIVSIPF